MNPTGTYFEQYVLSADPIELVRMLYKRTISLVREARRHLAAGDILARSTAINQAYDILLELIAALRDDVAPALCQQLRDLYFYMQQRLLDANLKQQEAPLKEVAVLLETLAEAWNVPEPATQNAASGAYLSHAGALSHQGMISRAYAA